MNKAENDSTERLLVGSLPDTTTLWAQKKVCTRLLSELVLTTSPGWTPSTFKSSRTDRATKKIAKPEDFMDEEDLSELQESRQYVSTHDQPAGAQARQSQDVPE